MTEAPARAPEEWPLVSVIMPTRGRPELVRESIAAVVAQTYPGQIEAWWCTIRSHPTPNSPA